MPISLKTRLILLCVGIVALAVSALGITEYVSIRQHTLQLLSTQATQLADAQAEKIGLWLADKQRVVTSLKPHALGQDQVTQLRTAVQAGGFDQAYMGYPDGRYVFSEQRPRAADYNPTQRPWYQGAVAAGGPAVTRPYLGASTGRLIVTFSEPVSTGGRPQAVVAGDVMLDWVSKDVAGIRPTEHSFAFLVGGDGQLIAHPDSALALKPLNELHPDLTLAQLGEDGATWHINGREGLVFSRPVPGVDWRLAIVVDKAETLAVLESVRNSTIGLTLLFCLLAAGLLYWAIDRVLRRLDAVREAIVAAGQGDFSQRLTVRGQDELTQIGQAYNRFADNIARVLQRMRAASVSVETATSEIAAGNRDLSSRTEEQADSLAHTVVSVDALMHNVRQNAASADQANQFAQSASAVAHRGGAVVASVVDTMQEINQSSRRITDIVGVIDSIAFQTNLLALNAAVEAARAGEQGKGFAVVAAEVRHLAQRSAQAAREIGVLISDSVHKVENGATLVQQAGATMDEIVASVQRVTDIMGEISHASQTQSAEIAQINQAVVHMEGGTQQNTAMVEQAAAAAASLRDQASSLAQMVSAFRLGEGGKPALMAG